MKKVLFTATVDSHILQFHLPFLKLFKENGYEVHVATNGKEDIPYCDYKHTIPFERSPFKLNNIKAIIQLKKIIDTEKFNIIHTHTPVGSVVTRLAAKHSRKKYHTRVIYTAHGLHFFKGAPLKNWILFYPIEKYLSKYTDTLILINHEDFDLCKRKFKKCMDIQYVPGVGIDTQKYSSNLTKKEKDVIKEKMNLNKDDVVLTCIARLDKNKNQGFLINVMNDINKINPKIKLLLVGPDENHKIYHELVENQKLKDCIYFTGKRTDIPEILSISDIVLSASYREGLPVNIMEAMAFGLPVVVLNCRGMEDLITNGENGFIVQRDNKNVKEEYTKCILKILDDNAFYTKISNNNLKQCKKYDIEKIVNAMDKIYFKKKKILHILASNSYSGAENVACTISNQLSDSFEFGYCSIKGNIENILKERNILYLPISKLNYKNVKKIIKKYNPDIIHAHDFKASFYSCLFSKKYTIFSQIHKNDPKMKKISIKSILFLFISKKCRKVIVVSKSILNEYIFRKLINKKIAIIPNYVNKQDIIIKSTETNIKKRYDLYFFGRLSEEKNPFEFIEIVNKMKKNKLKAIMIGDGPLFDNCLKMISSYSLSNYIDIVGFQKNPYPYILASKIGVMPSKFEGFGLTAIEGLVLNKVVLNSGIGGLKEIFENKQDYICKSIDEYTKKINYYLNNTENEKVNIDRYCDKKIWIKEISNIYEIK